MACLRGTASILLPTVKKGVLSDNDGRVSSQLCSQVSSNRLQSIAPTSKQLAQLQFWLSVLITTACMAWCSSQHLPVPANIRCLIHSDWSRLHVPPAAIELRHNERL